tara:strand:- start:9683 stop:10225 length:543 start_codon:yes stop_codon:yes gene_type:complete
MIFLPNRRKAFRAGGLSADAGDDFSSTQGATGWHYGYFTTEGSGTDVSPADPSSFSTANMSWAGADWRGNEQYDTPRVAATTGHPGVTSRSSAVWKYTVIGDHDDVYLFFEGTGVTNGATSFAIWHNSTKVAGYAQTNGATQASINATRNLSDGDEIFFEVNCRNSPNSDSVHSITASLN